MQNLSLGNKAFRLASRSTKWENLLHYRSDLDYKLAQKLRDSQNPAKIDLGIESLVDGEGQVSTFPSVLEAYTRIVSNMIDMEYGQVSGNTKFLHHANKILYGDSSRLLADEKVASVQLNSGSQAYSLAILMIKSWWPHKNPQVFTTNLTWPVHDAVLQDHGMEPKKLPYYNSETKSLDFERMCETLSSAPENSVVVLQGCAHNPTGVDPTPEQWRTLAQIFVRKRHFALFDMAYQGLASGDLQSDNLVLKIWEQNNLEFAVAQSFSQSMNICGNKLGVFSLACETKKEAQSVQSQIEVLTRCVSGVSPRLAAEVGVCLLEDPKLKANWMQELKAKVLLAKQNKQRLVQSLAGFGCDWSDKTHQNGLFAYTGLHPHQSEALADKFDIYLGPNTRIDLTVLKPSQIEYVAKGLSSVTN